MRISQSWERSGTSLYKLSESRTFFFNCIHYDDGEVNKANVQDVIVTCDEKKFNNVVVLYTKEHCCIFPSDEYGRTLHDSPLSTFPKRKRLVECFMQLFGSNTILEHHIQEKPQRVSDNQNSYDNWHPDFPI